jgi:hypothetical protein
MLIKIVSDNLRFETVKEYAEFETTKDFVLLKKIQQGKNEDCEGKETVEEVPRGSAFFLTGAGWVPI